MNFPDTLRYSEEHEWVRVEGGEAVAGITDFAQKELTDIVFVELPEIGRVVEKGGALAVVESVKAVSDVYSPVSGEVVAVNETLPDKRPLPYAIRIGRKAGWCASSCPNPRKSTPS